MSFENITKTYNSFSGCDMAVTCNILNQTISLGSLQTISYSIHMDRQPVRSIGNINAKDYTLGPRTIAGSLVFAVFDKHLLYHMIEAFWNNKTNTYASNEYTKVASKYQSLTESRHILADELPPFDITISFANEYGTQSKAAIYGVRLVNEGQVMSINDIYTENTYQFVATDIDYMRNQDYPSIPDDSGYDIPEQTENDIKVDVKTNPDVFPAIKLYWENDYDSATHIRRVGILKHEMVDMESVEFYGGVLTVYDDLDHKSNEFFIPSINNPAFQDIKLEPNHPYTIVFVEDKTQLSAELLYTAPMISRILPPVVERINYNDVWDMTLVFKCLSAYLSGHTKFVLKSKNNDEIIATYNIDDIGCVTVPVSVIRDYDNSIQGTGIYIAYTCSSDNSSQSKYSTFAYTFEQTTGLYDYLTQKIRDTETIEMFDRICNTYQLLANDSYTRQISAIKDKLIRNGLFETELDFVSFINTISSYESDYLYGICSFSKITTNKPIGTYLCCYYDDMYEEYHIDSVFSSSDIYNNDQIPNEAIVCSFIYSSTDVVDYNIIYKPSKEAIAELLNMED